MPWIDRGTKDLQSQRVTEALSIRDKQEKRAQFLTIGKLLSNTADKATRSKNPHGDLWNDTREMKGKIDHSGITIALLFKVKPYQFIQACTIQGNIH